MSNLNFTTLPLHFDVASFEVPNFRPRVTDYENFEVYLTREVLPRVLAEIPEVQTIRCSVSGYPIGKYDSYEVASALIQSMHGHGYAKFNDLLYRTDSVEVMEAIEAIVDDVRVMMVLAARKAPGLSYVRDSFAIASYSEPRQLSILLNQFLFDAGVFKNSLLPLTDMVERNRKVFAIADMVIESYDTDPNLQELRKALVELDAKYRISTLIFSRKEHDKLQAIRNANNPNSETILEFVMELIAWRDEFSEIDTNPRWTNKVFGSESRTVAFRPERSNIVMDGAKTGPVTRPSGSKGPLQGEALTKFQTKQNWASLLDDAFGSKKAS